MRRALNLLRLLAGAPRRRHHVDRGAERLGSRGAPPRTACSPAWWKSASPNATPTARPTGSASTPCNSALPPCAACPWWTPAAPHAARAHLGRHGVSGDSPGRLLPVPAPRRRALPRQGVHHRRGRTALLGLGAGGLALMSQLSDAEVERIFDRHVWNTRRPTSPAKRCCRPSNACHRLRRHHRHPHRGRLGRGLQIRRLGQHPGRHQLRLSAPRLPPERKKEMAHLLMEQLLPATTVREAT